MSRDPSAGPSAGAARSRCSDVQQKTARSRLQEEAGEGAQPPGGEPPDPGGTLTISISQVGKPRSRGWKGPEGSQGGSGGGGQTTLSNRPQVHGLSLTRAHTHIHTHDGMQKLAPPWRMDPQSPQTQPRHMPAKREQLRPLGPHRRHLVTRESPRCQATGCWVGPAGTPWSPVFSTGACHPHASQSPALPLPGLKQKSPDFSRTDSGSSPSSPPPCDQDPSQARRRRSLLHEDCTNPRTDERTEGRNRGPSATAQQGLGSWLKHPRRE